LGGAAGAALSSTLAGLTKQASDTVGDATGSTLLGNIAGNLLSGAGGALIGGSSGAAAASNVDLYNQNLDSNESEAEKEEKELRQEMSQLDAAAGMTRSKTIGQNAGDPMSVKVPPAPGGLPGAKGSATNTPTALQQATNLFSSNSPGTVQIGGTTFTKLPNTGNAAIFSGATDSQVQQYFMELTGASQMPAPITIPGKGSIYVVSTPSGNFTLRDFSSSSTQTGSAWTIDIPKAAVGKTYNPEIKFLTGGGK
jgi:filamentous hemagglutinin